MGLISVEAFERALGKLDRESSGQPAATGLTDDMHTPFEDTPIVQEVYHMIHLSLIDKIFLSRRVICHTISDSIRGEHVKFLAKPSDISRPNVCTIGAFPAPTM
jgi:hypothetical protein